MKLKYFRQEEEASTYLRYLGTDNLPALVTICLSEVNDD